MFDDLCLNTKFELFWQPNGELISWISHIETNKVKYSTIYYDINWAAKLMFFDEKLTIIKKLNDNIPTCTCKEQLEKIVKLESLKLN